MSVSMMAALSVWFSDWCKDEHTVHVIQCSCRCQRYHAVNMSVWTEKHPSCSRWGCKDGISQEKDRARIWYIHLPCHQEFGTFTFLVIKNLVHSPSLSLRIWYIHLPCHQEFGTFTFLVIKNLVHSPSLSSRIWYIHLPCHQEFGTFTFLVIK